MKTSSRYLPIRKGASQCLQWDASSDPCQFRQQFCSLRRREMPGADPPRYEVGQRREWLRPFSPEPALPWRPLPGERSDVLYLVPIGRRHTTAPICCRAFEGAAWPVSALLVSWRIVVNEYTFNDQMGNFSSPLFCKNIAFWPSPTKIIASCGIEIRLF